MQSTYGEREEMDEHQLERSEIANDKTYF